MNLEELQQERQAQGVIYAMYNAGLHAGLKIVPTFTIALLVAEHGVDPFRVILNLEQNELILLDGPEHITLTEKGRLLGVKLTAEIESKRRVNNASGNN